MKKAFTLIELLVVIAIIAILAAILFPVFAQAKAAAKASQAISNMKQIGTSFYLYMGDYDDILQPRRVVTSWNSPPNPPSDCGSAGSEMSWKQVMHPYMKNTQIFNDPMNKKARYPDDTSDPALRASWGQVILPGTPLHSRGYAYYDAPFVHMKAWVSGPPCQPATVSPNSIDDVAKVLLVAEHKRPWVDTGPWLDWNWNDWDPITGTIGDWPWGGNKWDDKGMILAFHDSHAKRAAMTQICGKNDEVNMWNYQRNMLASGYPSLGDVSWFDTFCTTMPPQVR